MNEALRRVAALVRKELLAILKDPRGRVALFAPPIFMCLIFGYAATLDLTNAPYVLVNQDRGPASQELLARLDGTGLFRRVGYYTSQAEAAQAINTGQALLLVQIPADFQRRLEAGWPAQVQVLGDGRNANTVGTALGYVNDIVGDFNARWREQRGLPAPALQPVSRAWYNPNLETRWNMIPGLIGTLAMMQTVMLAALSTARERELGTMDQLLVTPLKPIEVIAGKTIPSMLVGGIQAACVLVMGELWFRIPFQGSFLVLGLGLLLFLLAAVGMGLFVSSIANTMQQAMLYTMMVLMPFMLLSGLMTPISSMPPALQAFTAINPLRYAIDMSVRVYLEGVGVGRLMPDLWPLALIAVGSLTGAAWVFERRLV